MKTFNEMRQSLTERAGYQEVRQWVFDHLENTDMTSDQMKSAFRKKFGDANDHDYERAVSEYMD